MKFTILGSCVTRDMFRVVGREDAIGAYYARTSVPSMVSPPLACEVTVSLASAFQTRVVENDLYKRVVEGISKPGLTLLLDCIDERFPLLSVGEAVITKSTEFVASGLIAQIGEYQEIDRFSPRGRALYAESCQRLRDRIDGSSRVFLHQAFWCEEYIALDGTRKPYPSPRDDIRRTNDYLSFCYDQLARYLTLTPVSAELGYQVAFEGHRWELMPYHYVDGYYWDVWEKVCALRGVSA